MVNDTTVGLEKTTDEVDYLMSQYRYEEALDRGLAGLAASGVKFPEVISPLRVVLSVDNARRKCGPRAMRKKADGHAETQGVRYSQLKLMTRLVPMLIAEDSALRPLFFSRFAVIAMKVGPNPYTAVAFACYGWVVLRYLEDDNRSVMLQAEIQRLREGYPDEAADKTVSYIIGTYLDHMRHGAKGSLQWLGRCEGSDPLIAMLARLQSWETAFYAGYSLAALKLPTLELLQHWPYEEARVVKLENLYRQSYEALLNGGHFDLSLEKNEDRHLQAEGRLMSVIVDCHWERYDEAHSTLDLVFEDIEAIKVFQGGIQAYFYKGVLLGKHWLDCKDSYSARKLRAMMFLFRDWYRVNPDGFDYLYGLILGLYEVTKGRWIKGVHLMKEAVGFAEEKGNLKDKALGLRLIGLVHEGNGQLKTGKYYCLESAQAYEDWGALAIASKLRKEAGAGTTIEEVRAKWQDEDQEEAWDGEALTYFEGLVDNEAAEDLVDRFMEMLGRLTDSDKVLYFHEDQGEWLGNNELRLDLWHTIAIKVIKECVNHGEEVIVNGDRAHRIATYDGYIMDHHEVRVMAMPIKIKDVVVACVYVEKKEEFTNREIRIALRLAEQIGYLASRAHDN